MEKNSSLIQYVLWTSSKHSLPSPHSSITADHWGSTLTKASSAKCSPRTTAPSAWDRAKGASIHPWTFGLRSSSRLTTCHTMWLSPSCSTTSGNLSHIGSKKTFHGDESVCFFCLPFLPLLKGMTKSGSSSGLAMCHGTLCHSTACASKLDGLVEINRKEAHSLLCSVSSWDLQGAFMTLYKLRCFTEISSWNRPGSYSWAICHLVFVFQVKRKSTYFFSIFEKGEKKNEGMASSLMQHCWSRGAVAVINWHLCLHLLFVLFYSLSSHLGI